MTIAVTPDQAAVCARFGTQPYPAAPDSKVGFGGVGDGPVHGLRHPPTPDTTGWYIWHGELTGAPDFFQPLHVAHLDELVPHVARYLALPPGWRFLIAQNYEDVWYDADLLNV